MSLIKELNRLKYWVITLVIMGFMMSTCLPPSKSTSQTSPSPTPDPFREPEPKSDEVIDSPNAKFLRTEFLAKAFTYFYPLSPPTVNFLPTRYYASTLPKATVLGDYNKHPFACWMAVNFAQVFEKNLPSDLLAELEKRQLRNKELVDITWVIQPLGQLGGNTEGAVNNITYLKGHGWADPDSKAMTSPIGVDRSFLYGIFDADIDISYEVKLGSMKPFRVYTHYYEYVKGGVLSPQTAALRLPNATPESMALWSLVIDSKNPTGKVKAVATLHWLISVKDQDQFLRESFVAAEITDFKGDKDKRSAVPFATIGAYISMLQSTSSLKDSSLVKKLSALIKP